MCGRKTLTRDMQSIIEELAIEEWMNPESYFPSYNIAPTQLSPILGYSGKRIVKQMRWGLIPSWAKDKSIGSKMINARSESLLEKPSFRNLVSRNRCIVIADGYYEWHREGDKKTPYYIHHPDRKLLPLAGLCDTWKNEDGEKILSYTVITTEPTLDIAFIHDRMPVILKPTDIDQWIQHSSQSVNEALELLQPYPEPLNHHSVSTFVNSPKNNSEQCIQKAESLF
ncbi:MAG: SOS response-associated peptidase [Candidatus Marinimicrobia bacterium]|jgi:putative SOS response-associated peptidase YedK|nr:SOS response-associated peptidase [Candidatus Neomarinimicrobiota bacterium]MDP6821624.1 SOS response-associated peptidase [Candidatus Neomarinimicrobiota bacterium]